MMNEACQTFTAPAPVQDPATSVRVISEKYDAREGMIIVEGPTFESVSQAYVKAHVIGLASARLSAPGISAESGAYPVNADGAATSEVMFGKEKVAGYRNDYRMMASR